MFSFVLLALLVLACYVYVQLTPRDVDPQFLANQASIASTRNPREGPTFRSLANDHQSPLLGTTGSLKYFEFERLWSEVKSLRIKVVSSKPQATTIDFEQLVKQKLSTLKAPVVIENCDLDGLVTFFAATLAKITPELPNFVVGDKPETANLKSEDVALVVGERVISKTDLAIAVASQLSATNAQYRLNKNDVVFVAPGPISVAALVATLAALVEKAEVVFAELGPLVTATSLLQKAKPTIMVSDDISMRTLAKQCDLFLPHHWLQYGYRRLRLAKGALTQPAMLPGFQNVRAIYSISGPDPQQWLDNTECAALRVLTGTQLIHQLAPDDGLAVAQTSIGDYRAGSNLPGTVWGPPLPGLELKVAGGALYVLRAGHKQWELLKTVKSPQLLKGGCLYSEVERPKVSEEYFYTGRLDS